MISATPIPRFAILEWAGLIARDSTKQSARSRDCHGAGFDIRTHPRRQPPASARHSSLNMKMVQPRQDWRDFPTENNSPFPQLWTELSPRPKPVDLRNGGGRGSVHHPPLKSNRNFRGKNTQVERQAAEHGPPLATPASLCTGEGFPPRRSRILTGVLRIREPHPSPAPPIRRVLRSPFSS